MIRSFVAESCNAPGTATTISLGGAYAGRNTFRSQLANGAAVYYAIDDEAGTWMECLGTLTYGSPDTLTRVAVLRNSAGTTTALNFTGACIVYSTAPCDRLAYFDSNNVLTTGNRAVDAGSGVLGCGAATAPNHAVNLGMFTSGGANGGTWRRSPDGVIEQWGASNGGGTSGTIPFPILFPSNVQHLSINVTGGSAYTIPVINTYGFNFTINPASFFYWRALGT